MAAVSICTANAVASSTVASSLDQVCTFSIIFGSVSTIGRRATQYADSVGRGGCHVACESSICNPSQNPIDDFCHSHSTFVFLASWLVRSSILL